MAKKNKKLKEEKSKKQKGKTNKQTKEIHKNLNKRKNEIKKIKKESHKESHKIKQNLLENKNIKQINNFNGINNNIISKNPNLKYKCDITQSNDFCGVNDIFEVFTSYKDTKIYVVSPNYYDFNLDIFDLFNNKLILSLKGNDSHVTTIRYFLNDKNYNEYLISANREKTIIVWDITNNYKIKYKIKTEYKGDIFSCLIVFPKNSDIDYFISSTNKKSSSNYDAATVIYSLNSGQFVRYIKDSNNNEIYYLISWYNKRNKNHYIIQLGNYVMWIDNLLNDEFYYKSFICNLYFSGFIYTEGKSDYLCVSTKYGDIYILNLYNKTLNLIFGFSHVFMSIIQWNNKYIIVADYKDKSFKIIDFKNGKFITDFKAYHKGNVKCIKKISHPIYGEYLLSADEDKTIKLWYV